MNHTPASPPPSDDELHAFVDGQLDPQDAARIEAHLTSDPAASETVRAWRTQRERLRQHLSSTLAEPVPSTMLQAATGLRDRKHARQAWTRLGGLAAGLLIAFLAGWAGHAQWQGTRPPGAVMASERPRSFAQQALIAHAVYAPEQRHPVEVDASQQEHLVQWLSKRLGHALRVPRLSSEGFDLVGGRLLPGDSGARAQFMYQASTGERVTLYIGAVPGASAQGTAFRFASEQGASSFYWIDGGFGYALSGPLPRQRLLRLAELAHASLQP